MAPSAQAHNRSHSLLLLQKLLNQRDSTSPLTLILDTLEQSAGPLVQEFLCRAKTSRSRVIFVSFTTVKKPQEVDVFIKARRKSLKSLTSEILLSCPPPSAAGGKNVAASQRALIVVDSLNPLAAAEPQLLTAFLSGIITPASSVAAVYHADTPLVLPKGYSEYAPDPAAVLSHMATAIFRVSSLYQAVEKRKAENRSLPEPKWGLQEGEDGVLVGLKEDEVEDGSERVVVEMEMRRRSGRAVVEKFILTPRKKLESGEVGPGSVVLLADHPLFASPDNLGADKGSGEDKEDAKVDELMGATFNLGLTEKQRRDREGVVLPYFDAQTDIGAGEGGRILYEMGREDDFDDEEDEI